MPHCYLEYSSNIKESVNPKIILTELNSLISAELKVDIKKIKSRAIERAEFVVSDGENNQAFIHLEVAVLAGRPDEDHIKLSKALHQFLKSQFQQDSIHQLPISVTVEVRVMESDTYVRESVGEL